MCSMRKIVKYILIVIGVAVVTVLAGYCIFTWAGAV